MPTRPGDAQRTSGGQLQGPSRPLRRAQAVPAQHEAKRGGLGLQGCFLGLDLGTCLKLHPWPDRKPAELFIVSPNVTDS